MGVPSNAIVEVAELGFTVVVGILLDTFVVRPLPVPAIATIYWALELGLAAQQSLEAQCCRRHAPAGITNSDRSRQNA